MINEIRERDVSQIKNVEQQQVARLRLAVLAELANKPTAFRKIRNGVNTKNITPTEKQSLANAIRKATKDDPLKLENGPITESEQDMLFRLVENPNKGHALAIKIGNGMGQSSREANAARKARKVGKNRSV
jgi:hypothetical protein